MKILPVFCCGLSLVVGVPSHAEKSVPNLASELSLNAEAQARFFAKYPDLVDEGEVVTAAARALAAEGAPPRDEAAQAEALAARARALLAQRTPKDWQRKAISLFPALGVAGSEFNQLFLRHHGELKKTSPQFMEEPSWPVLLAKRCADELRAPAPVAASAPLPTAPSDAPPASRLAIPTAPTHRAGVGMSLLSIVLLLTIIALPARGLFRCSRAFSGNGAPLTAWQRALGPAAWVYLAVAVLAVLRTYFANGDQSVFDRFGIALLVGLLAGVIVGIPAFALALGFTWWLRLRSGRISREQSVIDAGGRKA